MSGWWRCCEGKSSELRVPSEGAAWGAAFFFSLTMGNQDGYGWWTGRTSFWRQSGHQWESGSRMKRLVGFMVGYRAECLLFRFLPTRGLE